MKSKTTTDIDQQMSIEIGAKLRQARRTAGLSQATLAEELGVTFQQVQKYEKGSNRISAPKLVQVCKVLGCSPMDFLGEHMDGPATTGNALLNRLSAAESKLAQIRSLTA